MATRGKYPKQISSMIQTAYNKDWNATRIADHINSSRTAQKLGFKVTQRSIAAKMANLTRSFA